MNSPSVLLCLTGFRIGGGIAAVSRCIARALDQQVAAGRLSRTDRVLLLDEPSDPAPAPTRGEQYWARGSQARFVWQVWRAYRRHRHDWVIFDLVGLARSIAIPLPGFPPRRIAIFAHGMELGANTDAAVSSSREADLLRRADVVLANSRFSADRLTDAVPELSARIRVIPLCIDPERVEIWESDVGAMEAPREPAALIVGRMWASEPGKGHDELIAAWPAVRRAIPGAELWIVGEGDDVTRLAALAREWAGDSVRFLGRVSDGELGGLYRRASVFAMPSRQEGFGLVYAEAMWWELPCIGSTADAAGQVIVPGETGELVPYGDVAALEGALVHLLSDRETAARMGRAGHRRAVEQFGYERFRADLLAALELG